jgi:hypothetical protein
LRDWRLKLNTHFSRCLIKATVCKIPLLHRSSLITFIEFNVSFTLHGGTTRATTRAMTESCPARSGNGQTYAFPPYVSGELSGRVTTLAGQRRSFASWLFGLLGITFAGWIGYLIAGFIGACILIAIPLTPNFPVDAFTAQRQSRCHESHIGLAVHPLVNPRYLLITGAVVEPLDHVAE